MKKRTVIAACALSAFMLAGAAGIAAGATKAAAAMEPAAGMESVGHERLHERHGSEGETGADRTREGKGKSRHHGAGMREVAKLLGMTKEELKEALKSGKTLAALAKERGVDRQKVVDLIAGRMHKRLDEKRKAGEITREEYDARKARIPEIAARIVDEGLPKGRDMHGAGREQAPKVK